MALAVQTYSFENVAAVLSGPGAPAIPIGVEAAVADEGITVAMEEDKDLMTGGADGSGMHTLRAGNRAKLTVRLLLTSPINGFLALAYNFQRGSSVNWGQNTLVITDFARGDLINASQVAFGKFPDLTYSKDGAMREWVFHAIQCKQLLSFIPG